MKLHVIEGGRTKGSGLRAWEKELKAVTPVERNLAKVVSLLEDDVLKSVSLYDAATSDSGPEARLLGRTVGTMLGAIELCRQVRQSRLDWDAENGAPESDPTPTPPAVSSSRPHVAPAADATNRMESEILPTRVAPFQVFRGGRRRKFRPAARQSYWEIRDVA